MVEDQPAQGDRRALRLFRRRRQPREECQSQSGSCVTVCQRDWVKGPRCRRPRWGLHGKIGDAVSIVPTVNPDAVTPHSEAFQAVIWHLLVTHPLLKIRQTKWEGTR